MVCTSHPRLTALLEEHTPPWTWIQVLIEPDAIGFTLRHVDDAGAPPDPLRPLRPEQLAAWAELTESGAFRPNKAAPTLRRGWICTVANKTGLETALEDLYPGTLADWYAARNDPQAALPFRTFINRQTGMYRSVRTVTDVQAAEITRTACHAQFCLRRRLWEVPGLDPDPAEAKSQVPCLDPCGLYLEFARRCSKIAQEPFSSVDLHPGEWASVEAALTRLIENPPTDIREGDTANPLNTRRLHFVRERLRGSPTDRRTEKEA
jgi:hypothetical protein